MGKPLKGSTESSEPQPDDSGQVQCDDRDASEIRGALERLVVGNVLGPEEGEDEQLPGGVSVREYYLVGMLAPRSTAVVAEEQEELAVDGSADVEGQSPDVSAPSAPSLFPSSLGFTFGVAGAATAVRVSASWGRYERLTLPDEDDEGGAKRVWQRTPAGGPLDLALVEGDFGPLVPDASQPQVLVRGRIRQRSGDWVVTAFLVNDQADPKQNKDEAWLFQAGLAAEASDGSAVFRRPLPEGSGADDGIEARILDMNYRRSVEFAVGHGIGVHVVPDPSDWTRAVRVETTAVPSYEVRRVDPPTEADYPLLAGVETDMSVLGACPAQDLPGKLRPLVEAYRVWIADERARVGDAAEHLDGFGDAPAEALDQCERVAARIEQGIDLLDPTNAAHDELAVQAFQFANRAMWQQRVHTMVADRRRKDLKITLVDALKAVDVSKNRSWRPFQLAFLLVNLPSLADPTHDERGPGQQGLVDLLWFPTGGGKTEAYLGLSAFTLAIRRLQGQVGEYDGTDGVAVLMRYTLRLLTVQQFQRAAALMCACERIRIEAAKAGDDRWGDVPFRLGLWVGYSVAPNKFNQAAKAIEEARGGAWHGAGVSPLQITFCPWCGSPVTAAKDVASDSVRRRTLTYCGDTYGRCAFSRKHAEGEGLPLITVDEEIYRHVPGMVIATADKFAQMPWQGPTRALFGKVTHRCERHGYRHPDLDEDVDERDSHHKKGAYPPAQTVPAGPLRPPDLIIQDELHLISGPLGSLMGLYEVAVDHLCTWEVEGKPVRPKVVASTATVRRAEEQAHQVFWRRLEVFPPPGLDAGRSFFALDRSPDEMPGRRYIGVCAPGRRIKAVEIRLYVALMGAAWALYEKYGEAVDPWMTLVGYFSALRELAGMSRLVDDDVSTRLSQKSITQRGLGRRFIRMTRELTSRIDSGEIPAILDQLSISFPPPTKDDEGEGKDGSKKKGKQKPSERGQRPIDVLLATNMISVGVDVPRLGLMVVGGQPKSTAEYIQATSRVGRTIEGPGLVVTALNWARPRDLSHFETFEQFHATFYRHVEALSVTPFAPRALDRGLSGIVAAMVRLDDEAANGNASPQSLDPYAAAAEAISVIKSRAASVTSRPEVGDDAEAWIKQRLDHWKHRQDKPGDVLGYRERKDGKTVGLLEQPGETKWGPWTCPTSLREVEVGINLLMLAPEDLSGSPDYGFSPNGGGDTDMATDEPIGAGESPS